MASTYNNLGIELQATGENAGTWGDKTNTNLDLIAETWGYISIDVAASDVTLAMTSGSSSNARNYILELTGTLAGNRIVDIPAQAGSPAANIEKGYIVVDKTNRSGSAYSLTFKVTGATGVTLRALPQNKSSAPVTTFVYDNGADIIDASKDVAISFTNGQYIADNSGNELMAFGVTASAVNEVKVTNAATGNGPIVGVSGETNTDLNLNPAGTGTLKSGTAAVKIAGKETMWVPATAMYAETTNGAELAQTVLSAGAPELKAFAFDASTAEAVQFNVSFPESWDFSTAVTFQTMWSSSTTNTGTGGFTLAGCSVANNIDYDLAFGSAVANTALAASGTLDDLMINVESGGVTIASAAASTNTIFRLVRDTGTDTNTGDLRLVGVKIYFTTNAANDA